MSTPALATVLVHPRLRGSKTDRAAVAEVLLVARARELADALGLDDVAGLLGGASNRAAQEAWEAEVKR